MRDRVGGRRENRRDKEQAGDWRRGGKEGEREKGKWTTC